jgi:hypothetical protein
MKKKTKKQRIKYHKPPMKYNVALHKFEPDLPIIKKDLAKNKTEINSLIISLIILLIMVAGIIVVIMSQG